MTEKAEEAKWIKRFFFEDEDPDVIKKRNAGTLYHRILHGFFEGELDPTSELGKLIMEQLSPPELEMMRLEHESQPEHKFR